MNELPKSNQTILIASSSQDEATWGPVARDLEARGYTVLAYEADKVATGEIPFAITVSQDQGLHVHYGGQRVQLDSIVAAWYRRPGMFMSDQSSSAQQVRVDSERSAMQRALWAAVPETAWLNSPSRIREAGEKIGQLLAARALGFTVPDTVISNSWDTITSTLPQGDVVVKMNLGILSTDDGIKLMYTTRLANDPKQLPLHARPFPGYWQPYHEKAREWRITAVGDQTFDAAVYTTGGATTDWRRPDYDADVVYQSQKFPAAEKQLCLDFLRRYGLRFGAFDFIEKPDGQMIFLECNPNGQFGWIEDHLGLPISAAIASELASIAVQNSATALDNQAA